MKKETSAGFCGIFCAACPRFQEGRCLGCKSAQKDPQNKSNPKSKCAIRECALKKKDINFCCQCSGYPCNTIIELRNRHLTERKYGYLHNLFYNLTTILFIGSEKWLKEQDEIWRCPNCGGRVVFLENKCVDCGLPIENIYQIYIKEHNYKIPDV
ncbi:MAG: DUF3795 domain-containing protein [Promethearchaeia archaeon]